MVRLRLMWGFLGVLVVASLLPAQGASFRIIVNVANPQFAASSSLDRSEVSQIFLKKVLRWGDGEAVLAVDQIEDSPVRHDFSRRIHGRSTTAIESYWQRQIFAGRSAPPPELASDLDVVAYVRRNRFAIGYVSESVALDGQVKVLDINE